MLICPQCEFENPEEHNFCQNCGVSLTHKLCCECQREMLLEAKTCKFCGADNHTVLWAIISQKKKSQMPAMASANSESFGDEAPLTMGDYPADTLNPKDLPRNRERLESNVQIKIETLSDLFSDDRGKTHPTLQIHTSDRAYNRYVLEPEVDSQIVLSSDDSGFDDILLQGRVIDRYPLQKPHLATLQKQQMDLFAELSQDLNDSYLSVTQYWNLVGLPTHALPYLILERYTPTVPKIYDAWQHQARGVVLLPDRSKWDLLSELWTLEKLPLLQVVWFLDEMAKLWEPLQRISCAQSLLVKDNLRLDEDGAFCFQQLYMGVDKPTLVDLARTWRSMLAESNLDYLERLYFLLDRTIVEEISDIEQLRLELHNLGLDESENFASLSELTNTTTPVPDMTAENFPTREPQAQEFFDEVDEDMMYTSEFEEQATAMIPMQLRDVTDACCTDIGVQRDHNEDFFGVQTSITKIENNTEINLSIRGLYIVCDGMGGHAAGEVASAMAVETLQKYFQTHWQDELPDRETIDSAVLQANETLYQTNIDNSRSGSGRMGTTLVMALLQDTQLAVVHVGDSRIYRITRKQGLEQLTLDHEVGQREINRGVEPEIAYGRPDSYQLTQALGPRENNYVRPDVQFMEIAEDCLLLLCSDGLSDNNFIEQNCAEYLEPLLSSKANVQEGLFELVNLANEHNGHDNITAVLLRIKLKPDF